ncbi:unnamed protein product [Parnassius apollo]|uniref:(apollo) hypothetical protein n=1 Tax=Parnassius apollo TaxID=110799 RepID=A0A8S3XW43_PARAO|nr:unnamed protein product [Parnassius apollo]
MLKELLEEVGNQSYSIILDESTDVTTEKYMAYCIRYYNSKLEKIVVDFLGFQEVFEATASGLYTSFKSFMSKMGLNLQDLIAIGTDGAIRELVDRLPLNVSVVEKIELFAPNRVCLSTGKQNIKDFPWQLGDPNIDREAVMNQWRVLSTMRIEEIIGTAASPNDIVNFWIQFRWILREY